MELDEALKQLNEVAFAAGMLGDIKEIAAEWKADRRRVLDLLKFMAKGDPKNAAIVEDFLSEYIAIIIEDQERGKKDDLR